MVSGRPPGSFTSLLEAIGFALDGDDLSVVDQAIDKGNDARGIGKYLAPFGEWPIGGDKRAVLLVPATDELEQQVSMTIGIGQVTDLVDHQEAGCSIVAQSPAGRNHCPRRQARRAAALRWQTARCDHG